MEASFWHNKWEIGQIGFHGDKANHLLVKHLDKLKLKKGKRIFLPLCGKTLDIAYLRKRGYQVTGIELSEIAVEALFKELTVSPSISTIGKLKRYQSNNIDIYVGDIFDLSVDILGNVDAIYDRAALIALPPETRKLYTKHLIKITKTAAQLLICLEYDQNLMAGPPFSIVTSEVEQHYKDVYALSCVERNKLPNGLKGKYPATDSAWMLHTL